MAGDKRSVYNHTSWEMDLYQFFANARHDFVLILFCHGQRDPVVWLCFTHCAIRRVASGLAGGSLAYLIQKDYVHTPINRDTEFPTRISGALPSSYCHPPLSRDASGRTLQHGGLCSQGWVSLCRRICSLWKRGRQVAHELQAESVRCSRPLEPFKRARGPSDKKPDLIQRLKAILMTCRKDCALRETLATIRHLIVLMGNEERAQALHEDEGYEKGKETYDETSAGRICAAFCPSHRSNVCSRVWRVGCLACMK
jgi:hypothetical protein